MYFKTDYTQTVKDVLRAPEVANAEAYPDSPDPNDTVFDLDLNTLMIANAEGEWVPLRTRAGSNRD